MPERATTSEAGPAPKRGLYGWRAFFAVFGCGTLAALLVFGSIYGIVRATVGSIADGPAAPNDGPVAEPKPMESLPVEKVEACKYIEGFALLRANPNKRVTDLEENYKDRNTQSNGRVVSDLCQWDVRPTEGSADWRFTFSFDAYVEAPRSESMEAISENSYENKLAEIERQYDSLESQGDASNGKSTAQYFYGDLESGDEGPTYTVVGHAHTAVFVIQLEDVTDPSLRLGDPTSKNGFHNSSKVTVERMGGFFDDLLPDDV